MKAHLLVFDPTQVGRDVVRDAIDGLASVENWTLFFGNTMCLASAKSAQSLSKEIRGVLPPEVRFVVTTINSDEKGGWLPKSLWQAINNPMPVDLGSDA